jgi:hypothetical protein
MIPCTKITHLVQSFQGQLMLNIESTHLSGLFLSLETVPNAENLIIVDRINTSAQHIFT